MKLLFPAISVLVLSCLLGGCIAGSGTSPVAPVPMPGDPLDPLAHTGGTGLVIAFGGDNFSTSSPEALELFKKGLTSATQYARYSEGLGYYDKALAIDRNFSEAWVAKGVALNNLGRYNEAIDSFDRSLALDPGNAAAWHLKSVTLMNAGRVEEVALCRQRAAELDPRYAGV
jgi:tetratricopeptide (TPR) repeat protein